MADADHLEEGAKRRHCLDYWKDNLAESQPAELLSDRPRPAQLSGKMDEIHITLAAAVNDELLRFSVEHKVKPSVVLLAAFRATHFRLTGASDATVGVVDASSGSTRTDHHLDVQLLQCLRIAVGDESFERLVEHVCDTSSSAVMHNAVDLGDITREQQHEGRDLACNPLFRIVVAIFPGAAPVESRTSTTFLPSEIYSMSKNFDIEVHMFEHNGQFRIRVLFSTDLFDPRTLHSLTRVFQEMLRQGLYDGRIPISSLPLTDAISTPEERGVLKIERTNYPRDSSVVDLFCEQARKCPEKVAVKDTRTSLTYQQLDKQSSQLSLWLRQRSYAPEALVGVFAPRSCATLIAFLGILKANLAYLPLDVSAPAGRIKTILGAVRQCSLVLVGSDVRDLNSFMQEIEIIDIAQVLQAEDLETSDRSSSDMLPVPSARSLAHVMFTSGSTGTPKGIGIEHRGIVRVARNTNVISSVLASGTMAHMANLVFDISTWEIYTALLNGGTLICVDSITVLEAGGIDRVFSEESVRIASFSPALLKKCLGESFTSLSGLDVLFVGGDRFDPHDALSALSLVRGRVFNGYGPAENTVLSTVHYLSSKDSFVNGVPIGRAVSNSGAFVVDAQQRIVPTGVMGELVVTGDGLARGYIDHLQDRNRFIMVMIDGQLTRAYRTGDYVRCRPMDGNLEFFGRQDHQVQIRGFRVELGEIEHALLESGVASDAVALIDKQQDREARLISFVTLRQNVQSLHAHDGAQMKFEEEAEEVESWKAVYDSMTYSDIDNINLERLGRDFVGWHSMYDGSEIPKKEMNEWLDDTIRTIINGTRPGHVLEIGTGTGMMLFNMIEGLQRYTGLEPSKNAVDFVTKMAKLNPKLRNKIHIQTGTVTDVSRLQGLESPLTVIVNSVVQYFPSPDYLYKAVEDLINLDGSKCVFLGDIRSYATYDEFLTTMILHDQSASMDKRQLRQKIDDLARTERELLVDPGFFTSLMSRLPNRIQHVEILPKHMRATNELSCFRFAAVLHTKSTNGSDLQVHQIPQDQWLDFMAQQLDGRELLHLLQDSAGLAVIAISNVPYKKTLWQRLVVDSLNVSRLGATDDDTWLASAHQHANQIASLTPVELEQMAEETGFSVEISWARQFSQRGGMDVVFHRFKPKTQGTRVLFQFPTDHEGRAVASLCNNPLQHNTNRKVEELLRKHLQTRLPSYMIPACIRVLGKLPVNNNGKVDRKALAMTASDTIGKGISSTYRPPRNGLERALCEEFSGVLGFRTGITDNFFDAGGHSILAIKVVSAINKRFGAEIKVEHIINFPTVAGVANVIRASSEKLNDSHMELDATHVTICSESNGADRSKDDQSVNPLSLAPAIEKMIRDILDLSNNVPIHSTPPLSAQQATYPRRVFLTGATGYLGVALLHRLLQQDGVLEVCLLVRAQSVEHARERVIKAATIAGWWQEKFSKRISCWPGDMRRPRFNLSNTEWLKLSGDGDPHECIDAVVHSGASVNWYSNYDALRGTNVVATHQLLKLVGISPCLRKFVFISTVPWMRFDMYHDGDFALRDALASADGYVRSKLVAEQTIVRTTSSGRLSGQRTAVLKPGYIIGNLASGIANVDDFLWRVVAGCVAVRSYPRPSEHSFIYISDYDELSSTTVKALYGEASELILDTHPRTLPTAVFWAAVNAALPEPLSEMPIEQWRSVLKTRLDLLGQHHPIYAVLHIVMEGSEVLGHALGSSEHELRSDKTVHTDLVSIVTRNVQYLTEVGYFAESWGHAPKGEVFYRDGLRGVVLD